MNSRLNWKQIIMYAGSGLSFLIGAGTLSGQEIIQFLVSYGYWGIGALLITAILMCWVFYLLFDVGRSFGKEKSTSQIYEFCLGKWLGIFVEYFTQISVFLIFVVMIAGAGATLNQYTGIAELPGRIVVTVLVFATVVLGLDKIIKIIGTIGPALIVLGVLIGGLSFSSNAENFITAGAMVESLNLDHPSGVFNWFHSALAYFGLGAISAIPFFSRIGSEIKNKKNALVTGLVTGGAYCLICFVFYLALLCDIGNVYDKQIPVLALAQNISPVFSLIFAVMIFAGLYSTAVPMCWTVCNKVSGGNRTRFYIAAVVSCVLGFFGANFPFSTLVNVIFPYMGVVGVIVSVALIFRYYTSKNKKASAAENFEEN